jgi:hypothetical protein
MQESSRKAVLKIEENIKDSSTAILGVRGFTR